MLHDSNTINALAKTSFGLEEVTANELISLGITNVSTRNRAVQFTTNLEGLYKANLWLRAANRILVPIAEFKISSVDDLYSRTKRINWEKHFDVDQTFAIDSTVFSKLFNHTKFAAFKAKDAVVDRFREKRGKRPDIDTKSPDIRINLHIDALNNVTISLDSSGDPLFKRGYRDSRSIAPMKEDLAAGLILLSQWDKASPFVDLFCGSGTLLIEAAMIANNIAPNINRAVFGFMNWKNFNETTFDRIVDEALDAEKDFKHPIIGVDSDGRTLGMARANIKAAGLTDKIQLFKQDFSGFKPSGENGIVVSNPPYGERIGSGVEELYKAFGDHMKTNFNGWSAWLISSNIEALKRVRLRPSRKIKVFNGSLECRFHKFEMYKGTKKLHKLNKQNLPKE